MTNPVMSSKNFNFVTNHIVRPYKEWKENRATTQVADGNSDFSLLLEEYEKLETAHNILMTGLEELNPGNVPGRNAMYRFLTTKGNNAGLDLPEKFVILQQSLKDAYKGFTEAVLVYTGDLSSEDKQLFKGVQDAIAAEKAKRAAKRNSRKRKNNAPGSDANSCTSFVLSSDAGSEIDSAEQADPKVSYTLEQDVEEEVGSIVQVSQASTNAAVAPDVAEPEATATVDSATSVPVVESDASQESDTQAAQGQPAVISTTKVDNNVDTDEAAEAKHNKSAGVLESKDTFPMQEDRVNTTPNSPLKDASNPLDELVEVDLSDPELIEALSELWKSTGANNSSASDEHVIEDHNASNHDGNAPNPNNNNPWAKRAAIDLSAAALTGFAFYYAAYCIAGMVSVASAFPMAAIALPFIASYCVPTAMAATGAFLGLLAAEGAQCYSHARG